MAKRKRKTTTTRRRKVRRNPMRGFTNKLRSLKTSTQVYGRKVVVSFNDIEAYIEKELGRGYLEKRQITKLRRIKQKLSTIQPHLLSIYRLLKST